MGLCVQKFKWIDEAWTSACSVPATGRSPVYIDIGTGTYRFREKDAWICLVDRAGRERPHITFDPVGKQWMHVMARKSR